ncbi:uncharacterized protein LOC135119600 [Zophobas morio]|uniref:uncharacterized protein LOC135119600 n=1 Tax=Zophobas morio TaxID=2755281 RepID=UPI003083D683
MLDLCYEACSNIDLSWVPCSNRIVVVGSAFNAKGAICVYRLSGANNFIKMKESSRPTSIKCLTFGATNIYQRHVATGSFDGSLEVWDLENLVVPTFRAQAHTSLINSISGIGYKGCSYGAPELATASRDGILYIYN